MKNFVFSQMDHLPDEVMVLIFDYSSAYDLTTSFQKVCTRWKYLINHSEKIWQGNIKLKGIAEYQCKNNLCNILQEAPKLKYLQIGNPPNTGVHVEGEDEFVEETEEILRTIRFHNKDLEYLHIIDRFPLSGSIHCIIERSKFLRLKITMNKLCDRREKIEELKKIYVNLPEIDNMCIDFCQRIQFHCERKKSLEWSVTHDFEADDVDEFS